MTSTNSKITKGADGVYRHPSGKPASYGFHKGMAQADGRSLTAAAQAAWAGAVARYPKPGDELRSGVGKLVKGWRAAKATSRLQAARVAVASEPLERGWRARRAQSALTAADRMARNISIRETAKWKKR